MVCLNCVLSALDLMRYQIPMNQEDRSIHSRGRTGFNNVRVPLPNNPLERLTSENRPKFRPISPAVFHEGCFKIVPLVVGRCDPDVMKHITYWIISTYEGPKGVHGHG